MPARDLKPSASRSINLMPPSEFEASFWGKFLKWGVSAGRYILIVTEMVVIAAFLFEFKLNDDLDNLNQTLEGQKNILQSMGPMEEEFRQVQARLETADIMLESQLEGVSSIGSIVEKIPIDVKLNSIVVGETGVKLDAVTISEQALGYMLGQLAADKRWKNVRLVNLVTDNTNVIKFAVEAEK